MKVLWSLAVVLLAGSRGEENFAPAPSAADRQLWTSDSWYYPGGCAPTMLFPCDYKVQCNENAACFNVCESERWEGECICDIGFEGDGDTCEPSADSDCGATEICCAERLVCEEFSFPGACGDPHMTGFRGQKFDFTGEDGGWYSVLSALPDVHLNMRVTSPVPSVPEITYITGISIKTTDAIGVEHSIVITVTNPHSLESQCPEVQSPCLANGALSVQIDGATSLLAPGEVTLGPNVAIAAVNLPGACRSFGFEKYWERKKAEYATISRRLSGQNFMQDMAEWILGDPTATNMDECAEYVAGAMETGGDVGLFSHDSEHTSFQILTPVGRIRLSHGRLHQLPMRDPTDRFDLPDHLTWQMSLAIEHNDLDMGVARGILGETLVPTVDENGRPIMQGMDSIRGSEEDYRVEGPQGTHFTQDNRHGDLSECGITDDDVEAGYLVACLDAVEPQSMKSLNIQDNDITFLPSGIFDSLTELEILLLIRIGLASLPSGIFDELTKLQYLYLGVNDLTTLPSGVFDSLTELIRL
eukprot:g17420.t1